MYLKIKVTFPYTLFANTKGMMINRGIQSKGSKMAVGKVKWFNEQKGYGFISPDDGSDDLFVHYSSIVSDGFRTLQENQAVEFEVGEGQKGPVANNVKPL